MRVRRSIIAALSGAALLFATPVRAGRVDAGVERAVLSSVLASLCDARVVKLVARVTIVMQSSPGAPPPLPVVGVEPAVSRDMARRSAAPLRLPATSACKTIHQLSPAEAEATAYPQQGVPKGEGAMPLYRLSRPGFAAGGVSAVLLVDARCGVLCGGMFQYRVDRVRGRWRVMSIRQTGVA
jgi:hypothetical protein